MLYIVIRIFLVFITAIFLNRFDEKPVTTEGCYYSFPQVENLMMFEPPDTILDDDDFLP